MIRLIRFFCYVCLLLLPLAGHTQQQTWRSADGQHSFQGEFVRLHNEVVTLHSHNTLMRLQLLENGNEVKHPIIELRAHNYEVHDRRRVGRYFQAMESPLKRVGNTVTWRGRMANNVVLEFVFELGNEGVEFGYRREVPEGLKEDQGSMRFVFYEGGRPFYTLMQVRNRYPDGPTHDRIQGMFGIHFR